MLETVRLKGDGCMHINVIIIIIYYYYAYEKTTQPIDSELIVTLENVHFKCPSCVGKCTQIKSNCMYARVHTLYTISTQKSIYSLNSRATYTHVTVR